MLMQRRHFILKETNYLLCFIAENKKNPLRRTEEDLLLFPNFLFGTC